DVQEGELRDLRTNVRCDQPDPDEAPAREGAAGDPARRQMAFAFSALGRDRVLAVAFAQPGRRAEIADPLVEPRSVLHEYELDSLGPVDLTDSPEIRGD